MIISNNTYRMWKHKPEYGREYWDKNQKDRRLTPKQLVEIAEGHIQREDAKVLGANRRRTCRT